VPRLQYWDCLSPCADPTPLTVGEVYIITTWWLGAQLKAVRPDDLQRELRAIGLPNQSSIIANRCDQAASAKTYGSSTS
jgi:hypothetical protein